MPRYDLSCLVDSYRDGWTLGHFLTHRFRYYPADLWAERLAQGVVRVNGDAAPAERVVRRGDRVEYALWHEEPDVDFAHEVLHEDEHVLAVAKSGNLPVHAGGGYIRNTLIAELRKTRGDDLRLAHRLDRETSGVILLAKSRDAARALEQEFHQRRVLKEYVAIVRGVTPLDFVVDVPIAKRDTPVGRPMRVVDWERGKPARTRFLRLAAREGEVDAPRTPESLSLSIVLVRPESGRTNQIRVHSCWAGHPVVGDKVYGRASSTARIRRDEDPDESRGWPDEAARHLLHCRRIVARHPAGTGFLDITAPPPADFEATWGGPLPPFEVSWPGIDPVPIRELPTSRFPSEGRLP